MIGQMLSEPSSAPTSGQRISRWVLGPVAVTLAAAAGVGWFSRHDAPRSPLPAAVTVETETVVRTDLSPTESLTGTLGYGPARPIKGGRNGVVTWLPAPGALITRGRQLYRADDRPVPLFYGRIPLYRAIAAPNTVGRDVRIVADNLQALGYEIGPQPQPGQTVTSPALAPRPVPSGRKAAKTRAPKAKKAPVSVVVGSGDAVLTGSLRNAIKRWQRAAKLPVTGVIAVGDVVVRPGPVRVESVTAEPGDGADEPLLTVTSTRKTISVPVEVTEAATVKVGHRVAVVLPDETSVRGTVTAIGTSVEQGEDGGPSAEPKRTVTVTVSKTAALKGIDAASVRVDVTGESHEDVLAVPVGALVALSEGGYAVQVKDGKLVAVTTGMFAKGLVEVSGEGLAEGLAVVTTS